MFSSSNEPGGTSYRHRWENKKFTFAGKTGSSKIKRFILEDNKENEIDQLDKEPEESIYTFGFTNQLEKSLMQEFNEVDWDKKIEISKKFIDLSKKDFNSIQRGKIYNEFSKNTIPHT